jgi:3-oxoacyl-[acyl-carrier protein] reductase
MLQEQGMSGFEGKVAVITGAARGMGKAHAKLLAERGASVVVQDILGEQAEETAREIRDAGGKAESMACDITETSRLKAALADAERRLGRIDILVNNAGIGSEEPLEEITEAQFDRMFAVHVKDAFFATQAVTPGMKARRSGKIINISSIWAMAAHHTASDYIAAKAALLGLTKAWAREFAPWNIHVNAVAPGGVLTEMAFIQHNTEERMAETVKRVPLGRYADPIELSYAVAFLASSESDFITGQLVSPNGGETIVGI